MPLIAQVGRSKPGPMLLIIGIYVLLIAGSVTMVYPFSLMISTAMTNKPDMYEYDIVPRFLFEQEALYRRYIHLRYDTHISGQGSEAYRKLYPYATASTYREEEKGVYIPLVDIETAAARQRLADLHDFLAQAFVSTAEAEQLRDTLRKQDQTVDQVGNAVRALLKTAGIENRTVPTSAQMGYHSLGGIWTDARGPLWPYWQDYLATKYTGVAEVNEVHKNQYTDLDNVKPPADKPDDPAIPRGGTPLDTDWDEFKDAYLRPATVEGKILPTRSAERRGEDLTTYLRPISMTAAWWDYLRRTHMRISKLNEAWGLYDDPNALPYEDWDLIRLPRLRPVNEAVAADWDGFVTKRVPQCYKRRRSDAATRPAAEADDELELTPEQIELDTADSRFVAFVADRYGLGQATAPTAEMLAAYGETLLVEYRLRLLAKGAEARVRKAVTKLEARLDAEGRDAAEKKARLREYKASQRSLLEKAMRLERLAGELRAAGKTAKQIDAVIEHELPRLAPVFKLSNSMTVVAGSTDSLKKLERQFDPMIAAQLMAIAEIRAVREEVAAAELTEAEAAGAILAGDRARFGPQFVAANLALMPMHERDKDDFYGGFALGWPSWMMLLFIGPIAAVAIGLAVWTTRRHWKRGLIWKAALNPWNWVTVGLCILCLWILTLPTGYGRHGALRRYFATCQFGGAFQRLAFHSDALFNTIWLIVLTIVTHLTVNPMAAYALSRFNLGYTYKILLLLLATMAFPPAVAMVPNFLMLKELHLLNTYWALVLPGMANGYSIFLLKGFFDALPKELYEAAEIDGASPMNCFVNITFPMSKPIFAINALSSFNWAYTGFMWAFVRCPDPRKWTLMVHVFNDNQYAIASVQMAILVIASIPTLLMFLFCQKIILRGIIIPSFK